MNITENDIDLIQNSIRFNRKILTLNLSYNNLNYKAV